MNTYAKSFGLALPILVLLGCTEQPQSETVAGAATTADGEVSPSEQSANSPEITLAEFEQIKTGMTREEVAAIVGGPGKVQMEMDAGGSTIVNVEYETSGFGKMVMGTFEGDKLMSKTQAGLE